MARRFFYWIAGFAVWLLLTWSLDLQHVIVGLAVSLLVAVFFGGQLPVEPLRLLNPVRWFWLIVYIPVFAYQCLKSNIDVALRVLS
ncbi:MAG: Na+/H+ antiporter subunit E, partial [candidate division WOR-3 bacterium]